MGRFWRHLDHRRGYFEGWRDGAVTGWVCDPAQPRKPQQILIICDGREHLLTADLHRADVHKTGIGDGYCGFRIRLMPGAAETHLRCVWADTGEDLPGSPCSFDHARRPRSARPGTLRLVLDEPARGDPRLSGYLIDSAAPFRRRRIGLFVSGCQIAQARASLYRSDARVEGGDGFNGFNLLARWPKLALLSLVDLDSGTRLLRFFRSAR